MAMPDSQRRIKYEYPYLKFYYNCLFSFVDSLRLRFHGHRCESLHGGLLEITLAVP